ncbi:LysR family transcriptional regulator [Marinisporobacter balticus]|uniref:DNA-binding transcriptional LysR family regulator n=1 Tax=Marinisporobacter balticus TaxID=2018667 RepID=A0A4R2K647_9FIRM|nr:LysR family transcriptional regulator [Marinisporobacter balticus]TCO68731.1 DNA-binding transcriptional LysR family regulator [Marinisporobacter balticus]
MELKQIEYFLAAIECRSLNKAAERLYTSQPNVSKILKNLETELGIKLMERTPKGVVATGFGDQFYDYAKNIIKTVRIVEELAEDRAYDQLKIAAFPSNMIARMVADYYLEHKESTLHIEFITGTVEDVVESVHSSLTNIGVVFYPEHKAHTFRQILSKKNLSFQILKSCKLCIYVGPMHPYYEKETIAFKELENLKFIQGKRDYFSMMEHVDILSNGLIKLNQMKHVVHTNSDNMMMNMLRYSDLCTLGLDFLKPNYHDNEIRKVAIQNCMDCIKVGYITRKDLLFNGCEKMFVAYLKDLFS